MATSRSYYEYLSDTLSRVGDVTFRPMMGEYLLYYEGTLVGGIYDDRLLVKPTASAVALLPNAAYALPYEGAKEMLLVEDPEDSELMRALFEGIAADLPKKKK
ncbi:MAG: TfoX/Sxy family protein [Clostridia bacterium]|nr:TfoX/Sxy family protein [Clostridia bacterium]